jgi:formate-dependent nitrite reductase cytochrome c552 subunit
VRFLNVIAIAWAFPLLTGAGELVGPETCKGCHLAAWESWRVGPHARALESLPPARRADRRCLSCHSPATESGMSGVGCEACHGPGRRYAASYVMRDRELASAVGLADPGERACLACHTESTPGLGRFDFARKLKLIAHPTPPSAR